jgi:hypothetical protein
VQRGLSIKDNVIVILQVAFNRVANLQMLVSPVLEYRKINKSTNCVDDVFCTWVVISTSVYEFTKVSLIMLSHNFRHCEILSDLFGNTELIQP